MSIDCTLCAYVRTLLERCNGTPLALNGKHLYRNSSKRATLYTYNKYGFSYIICKMYISCIFGRIIRFICGSKAWQDHKFLFLYKNNLFVAVLASSNILCSKPKH